MVFEITSYLGFEDKFIFSKIINKKCLRYYDFNDIDFQYKNIYDILHLCNEINNDEFCEYMGELCSNFTCELSNYYDEYYGYDVEDFMNDDYNNMPIERYRNLCDLFYNSYLSVYIRKIVEYIENNNIHITYDVDDDIFELEKKINIDIHNLVIEYYKYIFENENIDIFCKKCGVFSHHTASTNCIFYNVHNENKLISKNVNKTITTIIDKIIDNDYKLLRLRLRSSLGKLRLLTPFSSTYKKILKREPLLCYSCKINNKKTKCSNNCCAKCCSGCKIHK